MTIVAEKQKSLNCALNKSRAFFGKSCYNDIMYAGKSVFQWKE